MKINLIVVFLTLSGGMLPVHAQQSSPPPTAARVLGDLPDGTPPAPTPPKPAFIVPAKDILETKILRQGGRKITLRKIAPIPLAAARRAPVPIDTRQPAIQQQVAELQAQHPDQGLLFVSATVYRARDSATRTLVRIDPLEKGAGITFWSSANFAWLSGFSSFVGSDGVTRSLVMAWSTEEIGDFSDLAGTGDPEDGLPAPPELPAGAATFAVVSPDPAPAALADARALHELYNNERERLKTAFEGRERARLDKETELKAHPPKPKDIVLNYWFAESPAPAEGGAR